MTPRWLAAAGSVAVVRFDRLGDVVLTFPMFRVLREQLPRAALHLVCSPYTASAARGVSCIDHVHAIPGPGDVGALEALFRDERFDVVFFPLYGPRHALAALRAGIPHRVGTGRKLLSLLLYNHWILSRRSWRSGKHAAALNVEMVATVLGTSLDTTPLVAPAVAPEVTAALHRKLAERGITPGTPCLVVHPGSAGSAPIWPPEDFAQVAGAISRERGLAMVVTGVASEAALVERVRGHCPGAISLAGDLDLPELLALIAEAALVITNCTGPLHVATMYDTPVVGALTGADVPRWRPLNARGAWVASGPGVRDLSGVTVERFLAEARRVVALPPARRRT